MIDLNCDLGEGEPSRRTQSLLRWVTSANIACGGHAGDERTMRNCLRWCRELGVNPGAHPGFEDRDHFGRRALPVTPGELAALLDRQVSRLEALARDEGTRLAHLKLHGALYHAVEHDSRLARALVEFVASRYPLCRLIASANGLVLPLARRRNLEAWGEIFADRGYTPEGELVPRGEEGAVLPDAEAVLARAKYFLRHGALTARDGALLRLDAQTICLHADSPNAARIARSLASVLGRRKG